MLKKIFTKMEKLVDELTCCFSSYNDRRDPTLLYKTPYKRQQRKNYNKIPCSYEKIYRVKARGGKKVRAFVQVTRYCWEECLEAYKLGDHVYVLRYDNMLHPEQGKTHCYRYAYTIKKDGNYPVDGLLVLEN